MASLLPGDVEATSHGLEDPTWPCPALPTSMTANATVLTLSRQHQPPPLFLCCGQQAHGLGRNPLPADVTALAVSPHSGLCCPLKRPSLIIPSIMALLLPPCPSSKWIFPVFWHGIVTVCYHTALFIYLLIAASISAPAIKTETPAG